MTQIGGMVAIYDEIMDELGGYSGAVALSAFNGYAEDVEDAEDEFAEEMMTEAIIDVKFGFPAEIRCLK